MVSRRRFVTVAATTFVAAGVPAVFAPPASAAGKYSAAWWRSRLGASVELQGELWHLAELVEVHESTSSAEVEQFTLVFRGGVDDEIAEGIYTLEVAGRRVKLFVQATGSDDAGTYCQASIARLK